MTGQDEEFELKAEVQLMQEMVTVFCTVSWQLLLVPMIKVTVNVPFDV